MKNFIAIVLMTLVNFLFAKEYMVDIRVIGFNKIGEVAVNNDLKLNLFNVTFETNSTVLKENCNILIYSSLDKKDSSKFSSFPGGTLELGRIVSIDYAIGNELCLIMDSFSCLPFLPNTHKKSCYQRELLFNDSKISSQFNCVDSGKVKFNTCEKK